MAAVLIPAFFLAFAGCAGSPRAATPRPSFATRPEVYAPRAMACTSHPLATQAALEVMRAGGSAVDGAIAANACLGLMEPTGAGVGGDLFAIVWDPRTRRLHGYNASGRSPRLATLDAMRAALRDRGLERIPPTGPLPVTVPGAVDGWFALHDRFGVLPMEEVLAPAIRYAREGFPVSPVIAAAWARNLDAFARAGEFPNLPDQFTIDGRAPRVGETWKNPNLARTYEAIALGGREAFYAGEIGRTLAAFVESQGGFLRADDLASHRGEWVEPISTTYRGYEVWELPPNGQGAVALQMLNMLEGYDLKSFGFGSFEHVHLFVEAKKLAFEDRARYFADPAFARVPVARLISKDYAATRRARIDPARAARVVEPGTVPPGADTVYLTVADPSGMMVSLIQSNYRGMGSGMVPPGLGFMLQDRGEQFALVEGHPNALAPGKRPFHTIIPAFITRDGKPWMSFGVMGGDMQPQGHVQIVINLIDFGMSLQEAGDAPRIHHEGSTEPQGAVASMSDGGVVHLEDGFPERTRAALRRAGHRVEKASPAVFGGYQAIVRDPSTGGYVGASERRKDGCAAGY